jgi:hypothetical protein
MDLDLILTEKMKFFNSQILKIHKLEILFNDKIKFFQHYKQKIYEKFIH